MAAELWTSRLVPSWTSTPAEVKRSPRALTVTNATARASNNYRPEICKSCDRDTFPFSSCSSTSSWWEAAGDPPHLSPNAARTVTSGDCAVLTS